MKRYLYILPALLFIFGCNSDANRDTNSAPNKAAISEPKITTLYSNTEITWQAYFQNNQLVLEAILSKGWKLYSSTNSNFMGPMPTLISFKVNKHYKLIGKLLESNIYNPENRELKYFKNKAIFTQKIDVINGEKFALEGTINYMICNTNGCQPPSELQFSLTINL